MAASKGHVLIIGAGVTGLTSAWFLAEAGYQVTVIAAHVPGDKSIEYTSPWAGAHWRTHAKADEPILQDWDVQTYKFWLELLEKESKDPKEPKAGVKMYTSLHLWDGPVQEELWWATKVKNFRALSKYTAPVSSINDRTGSANPKIENAAADEAFALNVPQYLQYLQSRATSVGAKIIKTRLPTGGGLEAALYQAEQIAGEQGRGKVDVFLNATGLGAMKLCGDQAMFPIRGQTVLVKGEAKHTATRIGNGYGWYCIPRPGSGTTILGGTKEAGNWSEEVDSETTKRILENCAYFAPELLTAGDGGFEVVSVQCGLRPGRKGGPRIEREIVGSKEVVHAYGHAGGGYQNSIGSARAVVKLVGESTSAVGLSAKL